MSKAGSSLINFSKVSKYAFTVAVATLLTGCLASVVKPESSVTSKVGGGLEDILPPYDGPRAIVSVADFQWQTNTSKTTIGIGGTDFSFQHEDQVAHSDALTAMLSTALVQSKRFRVLERAKIGEIKKEIALQEDGYTDSTGQKRGNVAGADLQIIAVITGWEPGSSGKSGGLTAGLLGKRASAIVGAVSGSVKKSSMAMDIRIVDAATSELLAATSVETVATDTNFGGALGALTGGGNMGAGLSSYSNTPMEKAIRSGILEATRYLAENTPKNRMIY